ncbi:hypothetical protein PCK1_001103 [Pneumocystis canis]|nr:hypothetical protein PCK1_001103 [Pneumocystis canis]
MNKKNFLLINKADLMTIKQRKYWADYFEMKGINYTFFSAMSEKSIEENHINTRVNDILENIRDEVENSSDINKEYPIKDHQNISGNKLQIEKEDNILEEERTRIITVDELKNVLIKEIQLMSNNRDNFNTEKIEKFYVGLVGYPNVGKSSTINSLAGGKKVSVSATPGRTKHFQTIHITDKLVLCDCPGLVFPNFSTTRTELVCNGVLPIDQLQDYISPIALILRRIPKHIFESIYGVSIQIESSEKDEAGILTAEQFLTEYLVHRGIDKSRASRHIIKDYVNGKLLFCNPPPGIDPFTFNSEYYDSFKLFTDKHSKTNSFIKNEVFNMISKNAKKQKSFKTEELQNNKLLIFDKNFFYQNKSFLESNQKIIKSFCYKKYTGPNPTHSSEYHLRNNVLSKSKKHFKSYKRKNHHIFEMMSLSNLNQTFNMEIEESPIQPMHQGNLELQRQFLQRKIVYGGNIASPTDDLMSPTTAKLHAHKRKYYNKAKPQSLQSVFTQIQSNFNESSIKGS